MSLVLNMWKLVNAESDRHEATYSVWDLKDWTCITTFLSGWPPETLNDIVLADILTVEAKGIGDDVTVIWVRSPTRGGEAGGGAYQAKKIRYLSRSNVGIRDWQGAPHTLGICRVWSKVLCSIASELAKALQEMCSNLMFLFAPMNSVETTSCCPLQSDSVQSKRQHSNSSRDTA